jgi:hypothetical protein
VKLPEPRLPIGTDVVRLVTSLYDVLRQIVRAVNGLNDTRVLRGAGSPEGVVTANRGRMYVRTDGAAATTLYVKTADDGQATGWTAK